MELLTGLGLAAAAGLNAYIPLLVLGLASRFLDVVNLPQGWAWLESSWMLGMLAVLLAVEVVADKVPWVDTVNDWLQTLVRPASGGVAFGSATLTETVTVNDPGELFSESQWMPIVMGVLVALSVHVAKVLLRVGANAVTGGLAAPALSTAEDAFSVVLSVFALVLPVLVVVALLVLVYGAVRLARRRRKGPDRAEPPTYPA